MTDTRKKTQKRINTLITDIDRESSKFENLFQERKKGLLETEAKTQTDYKNKLITIKKSFE